MNSQHFKTLTVTLVTPLLLAACGASRTGALDITDAGSPDLTEPDFNGRPADALADLHTPDVIGSKPEVACGDTPLDVPGDIQHPDETAQDQVHEVAQDTVHEVVEETLDEVSPPADCTDDAWCVELYGAGVHCQQSSGACVPDESPDYPWCQSDDECQSVGGGVCHPWSPSGGRCAPECQEDDACIALSPNLRCDQNTARCVEHEPLACSSDLGCQWMGPDYQCNIKSKCLILPGPDAGCTSKEDCPMEPRVTVCHEIGPVSVCAPPCEDNAQCAEMGPGLACNFNNGKCQ